MTRAMFFWVCTLTACSSSAPGASSGKLSSAKPARCLTGPDTTVLYEGSVRDLAADGDQVVMTGDGLRRVPASGGPDMTIANADEPSALAVLNGVAYFTAFQPVGSPDSNGKQSSQTVFESVPVSGGDPTVLPDVAVGNLARATDDDSLYFDGLGPASVVKLTPPSMTPVTLALEAALLIDAIAVHGDYVYVAGQDLTAGATLQNGVIERVPKRGGTAQRLLSNIGHPWSLIADDTGLYWAQDPPGFEGSGTIVHANLDGTSPRTFVEESARSLAIVNGQLVIAWDGIQAVPLSGGRPEVVASDLTAPGMLVVVGGNVAWVDPVEKALSDPTVPRVMTACVPSQTR